MHRMQSSKREDVFSKANKTEQTLDLFDIILQPSRLGFKNKRFSNHDATSSTEKKEEPMDNLESNKEEVEQVSEDQHRHTLEDLIELEKEIIRDIESELMHADVVVPADEQVEDQVDYSMEKDDTSEL